VSGWERERKREWVIHAQTLTLSLLSLSPLSLSPLSRSPGVEDPLTLVTCNLATSLKKENVRWSLPNPCLLHHFSPGAVPSGNQRCFRAGRPDVFG
jgi:hypothetical protein